MADYTRLEMMSTGNRRVQHKKRHTPQSRRDYSEEQWNNSTIKSELSLVGPKEKELKMYPLHIYFLTEPRS